MRKKVVIICLMLGSYLGTYCQQMQMPIPIPAAYKIEQGEYISKKFKLFSSVDSLASELVFLGDGLAALGKDVDITNRQKKSTLILDIDPSINKSEAYKLVITPKRISITASTRSGIYYGVQSLLQILETNKKLYCGVIEDAPRYSWRGYMLDESRHFFGKEKVKQILMLMGRYKLNKFHWHLTDEPAWRIEIKKYPKLTSVGGCGSWSEPNSKLCQFYTQEDIKEIIAYAAQHHIEVIPEIDMPGHATAANKAYPEYSGGGVPAHPDFTFNPGKEEVYAYLTDILREVSQLFPSPYIHIGGDEVSFGIKAWESDPHVQALMKREGMTKVKEAERYFVHRMTDSITSLGKKMMGWDEIVDTKVDPSKSAVMWWRHDRVSSHLKKSIEQGYTTILCPRLPLYFDFIQHKDHKWGRTWGGFCPLQDVYTFPDVLWKKENISEEQQKNILGLQANLWTERIHTEERLDFMTWPRLCAVAEAGWSNKSQKDYDSFTQRLDNELKLFDKMGIYYFDYREPLRRTEPIGCERNAKKESMDFRD